MGKAHKESRWQPEGARLERFLKGRFQRLDAQHNIDGFQVLNLKIPYDKSKTSTARLIIVWHGIL